jgi:hypothetical protein
VTANSNLVNPDEPSVWGLDRQLALFQEVLGRNRPALILVTGKPFSGKSSFVREAGARAKKQGWKTAHSDRKGDLQVGPETTEEDFSKRVLELLGLSETSVETRRGFGAGALQRLPAPPTVQPATPAAEAGVLTGSRAASLAESGPDTSGPGGEPPQSTSRPLHPLARRLSWLAGPGGASNAPGGVLLLIDGYGPDPKFEEWFASALLNDLTEAGRPVAVAVADQTENLQGLEGFADQVISLDSLDRRDLQQRFEAIGREVNPPMESSEVGQYVDEALKRPQIIGPLRRVLALARQPA